MYRKLNLIALLLALASPAAAQQSTAIDRISAGLAQCVKTAEQGVDRIADLQGQLAAAQIETKRLKDKYEPEAKKD